MHITDDLQIAFEKYGLRDVLFYINADMKGPNEYQACYAVFTPDKLSVLYGDEVVIKVKGARKIRATFIPDECISYPLDSLGELQVEQLLTTARLLSVKDGEAEVLLNFSIGKSAQAEKLIKAITNVKNGKDATFEIKVNDELFCEKCGTRFPQPERKICPKCLDRKSISLRLFSFFKPHKKNMLLIGLSMFFIMVFNIVSPYIGTSVLFDEVLTKGGKYYGDVPQVVLLIFATAAIGVLLCIFNGYMVSSTVPWIVYDLKCKIFESMQKLSVGFYTSKQTGALMNRVNQDSTNIYWFFVDGFPYVVLNILTFAGVIGMMLYMNVLLALTVIVIIPTTIIMFRFLWKTFRSLNHKDFAYNSEISALVSDSLNGQRVIKAFAKQQETVSKFTTLSQKQFKVDREGMNIGFTAFPLIYFYMFIGQVLVAAIGGIMVVRGTIHIGTFMAFNAYLGMLYGPLEFLSWVSNWWARCVDSSQRMFEIMDTKSDVEEAENPVMLDDFQGHIELKDVKFGYEPAKSVIKGLSMRVEAGKMLGIVGKTGAGKTTIANLISRLYDTTEGEIKIDGVNVKELSLSQLRRNIGIVSQDMYLFIGTIADNIRYAKPEADIEEVIEAAKAASAHDFIMKFPDGYETRIGSGGQDLSGGEKQRLSIARAIIQDPKILILDEATAAMDTETEMNIQNSLSSLTHGCTTISIAHRLSTLKDADSLAVIEDGKLVEYGTFEELLRKKGEYFKLYQIQLEALKVINM